MTTSDARRKGVALTSMLLVLALLSFSAADGATTSTTTTSSTPPVSTQGGGAASSLVISIVPPKLPADGGSYPVVVVSLADASGGASLAVRDTPVFLTSSLPGIGSIQGQVTITKGSSFAIANFSTTSSPGSTTISGSSSGLGSASALLTTVVPSGYATRLAVVPVPGTEIANPGAQGTVIVEALDSSGFPARVSSPASVALSSSDNGIVSLPTPAVSFAIGAVIASSVYNLGTNPGKATITATSSGFNSGTGSVVTIGTLPAGLVLSALPSEVATSTTGTLVLTLVDGQGQPTPAPHQVSIVITSSNTTSVSPAQSATIGEGQVYTAVSFQSGKETGTANLTASSPGLRSASALVGVSIADSPFKLGLAMAPNPVPANNQTYNSMVVELEDANGGPAVATSAISVTLTSSNSMVGSVKESLTIQSGDSFAVSGFTSTFLVGSTFVTAIAQNLQSASLSLTSFGASPTQLVAQALPATLPADGGSYSALEVSLEESGGTPAIAPFDIPVQLTSSSTSVLSVNDTVVIPAGQSYAVSLVTTSASPGGANVTATASGFTPSTTGFTMVSPAPSRLGLYVAPPKAMTSLGAGSALVAVQLQDSTSAPGRAEQDTSVVVTSSNSSVISESISLEIPAGSDFAWAFLNASQTGTAVLTASSSGLASATANFADVVPSVDFTISSSEASIPVTGAAVLQLQLELMGSPIAGAAVTLSSTSGSIASPSGVTDESGSMSDTFVPTVPGVAIITAVADVEPFGNQSATTTVIVTGPGGPSTGGATSGVLKLVETFLPVVVVVVVIVAAALMFRRTLRRRRDTTSEDASEAG